MDIKKLMKFDFRDKKTLTAVISVCVAFVLLFGGVISAVLLIGRDGEKEEKPEVEFSDVRGVWIASVSNIDFPSSPDLSEKELKEELDSIVETVGGAGLNTVFFQVRPCSDALYASDIFPVSKYISTDGTLPLDALEYLVEKAHEKNIAVHAWINPLRVAAGGETGDLAEKNPARQNPSLTVKYADGKIYYDCGRGEVIDLVCDGVREIVENYAVDGIVFDDYFYPYPVYVTEDDGTKHIAEFDDGDTYAEYGKDYEDIGDWRRSNVNRLVKSVYETVKEADSDCLFGVAPFGIWKNGYGDESGSETRGSQSYYDIYCDTLAWVEGGYVDYIAPQIYWRDVDSAAPYDVLCDWWDAMVKEKNTDVRLLISHAAYRYEEDWENPQGIMTSQLTYASEKETYRGSIFYGYGEIESNLHGITDEIRAFYAGKESDISQE